MISFRVFVKEQFCMFSLLLEFSDGVSAFIIGFDSLSHTAVCLVVINPDPPPCPRGCSFPIHLPSRVPPLALVIAVLWSTACVPLVGFVLCLHVSLNGVSPPEQFELVYHYAVTGEGNGNPLQYSCLENPIDRGAWWTAGGLQSIAFQSWT